MLNDIFYSQYPKSGRRPKNLRDNAREFAQESTDTPFMEDRDAMRPVGRPGRGVSGESGN